MSNLWDFIQALPNGDPPCDFGVIIKRCLAVIFRKDANHRLFVAFLIIPSVFGSSFWTISGFFRSSFCIVLASLDRLFGQYLTSFDRLFV